MSVSELHALSKVWYLEQIIDCLFQACVELKSGF